MKKSKSLFLYSFLATFVISCSDQTSLDSNLNETYTGWLHHGGDHFSSKYAPFGEINADNFEQLQVAWRWQSADLRIPENLLYPTGDYRATPLYINGVIYTNTNHGQVAALDPASGKELWIFDPKSYRFGPPNFSPVQTRGIEYWTDGRSGKNFSCHFRQTISLY